MTQNLTGRAAAAAASMGQRAAAAGVGLCAVCRHPVRLHGDYGCVKGECECNSTGADLRAGVTTTAAPAVPPSAAELAFLDVRCRCGHVRTGHVVTGSHVQCKVCTCRSFVAGGSDAPAAPPAPAVPAAPVAAAPAPAAPPAAAPEPVREQPAPRPVAELPPWLPGAGVPHVKRAKPSPVVEVTTPDEDVVRQVDAIIAAAKRPRRTPARPAAPSALGSAAAVGERDAVEEVAAAAVDEPAAATVQPLDLEPLLARALWVSSRWYCPRCHSWPADPGACALCRDPLQAVYLVTLSRSVS